MEAENGEIIAVAQSDGSLDQELGKGFRAGFLSLGTTGTLLFLGAVLYTVK